MSSVTQIGGFRRWNLHKRFVDSPAEWYEKGLRPWLGEAQPWYFWSLSYVMGALVGEPGDLVPCLANTIWVAWDKFLSFLACHFCRVLVRTVVLNTQAHCHTVFNTLTFLAECLDQAGGWGCAGWQESSLLSTRCVQICVMKGIGTCDSWHNVPFLGGLSWGFP